MSESFKQLLLDNRAAKVDFDEIKSYLQRVADSIHAQFPATNYPRDGELSKRLPEIETFLMRRHASPR
jgi:hypothetical protein